MPILALLYYSIVYFLIVAICAMGIMAPFIAHLNPGPASPNPQPRTPNPKP